MSVCRALGQHICGISVWIETDICHRSNDCAEDTHDPIEADSNAVTSTTVCAGENFRSVLGELSSWKINCGARLTA